jgi:hypothetical protein
MSAIIVKKTGKYSELEKLAKDYESVTISELQKLSITEHFILLTLRIKELEDKFTTETDEVKKVKISETIEILKREFESTSIERNEPSLDPG